MRIASAGHAVFATTMISLRILGLVNGDFAAVWQPVPKWVPARELLAYLCAFIALASGVGLIWQRAAGSAARVLFAYLMLWLLLFKMPTVFLAPTVAVSYESWGETAVLAAGAWTLFARLAADWGRPRFGFSPRERGLGLARAPFGPAVVAFGRCRFA